MAVNRTDNAVLFWNGVLLEAMKVDSQKPTAQQEQGGPTRTSRAAAIVHAAIHNAVNGVQQRNAFYRDPQTNQPAPPGAPPAGARQEAAGAGAAYRTLRRLYQAQTGPLFDPRRATFEALPLPGANHQPSFAYGENNAQQLLNARANDGSGAPQAYVPPAPGPGVWVPDPNLAPPGPPLTPNWGNVRLFLLDTIDRVRPPFFPVLSSGDYAFAFRNVRDKGGAQPPPLPPPPQGRTADEENIAKFYALDDRKGTPILLYNQHAFEMLDQEPNVPAVGSVLHRHARMFALINLAMADAGIACWEAKFRPPPGYHIWRPFQAIPGAANDGNPETQPVANWRPLGRPQATDNQGNPVNNTTPNFPAYPSGHSSFGTASYGMLRKFFGTKPFAFILSSPEVPNKRSFVDKMAPQMITTWTQVIGENDLSRIVLGVHFIDDTQQGRSLGQNVADYIWPLYLRP
jgi:PAP2 superfamily